MRSYKATGVILKRMNLGESDRVVTVYTREHGKKRLIAKGARRPTARLTGSVELFYVVEFRLAQGKTFDLVTEANVVDSSPNIRQTLEKMSAAFELAELVDVTTRDDQPHQQVYDLVVEGLGLIGSVPNQLIIPAFNLKLLALLGFKPELYQCSLCHKRLKRGNNIWCSRHGGVVTGKTDNDELHEGHWDADAFAISDDAVKVLRLILEQSLVLVLQLKLTDSLIGQLRRVTDNFFSYHFDRELRASQIGRQLNKRYGQPKARV